MAKVRNLEKDSAINETDAAGTPALRKGTPPREETTITGSCLCGAVRFTLEGDPVRIGLCHCHDCRRASGSAFSMFLIWDRSAFACAGATTVYEGRSFCPSCGSRVFSLRAEEAEIMAGALDLAPTGMTPGYELWTSRREHWLRPVRSAEQFEEDRG